MIGRLLGRRVFGRALAIGLLLSFGGLSACATQVVEPRPDTSVGPALSVESFLQAVSAQDLDRMARLFGTASGPVADTGSTFGCMFKRIGSWIAISDRCARRQDVELRMNAIAMMLRHDDYRLGADSRVAGRDNPTTQIPVSLIRGTREIGGVPFIVVQGPSGTWLIEEIGLEAVTGP